MQHWLDPGSDYRRLGGGRTHRGGGSGAPGERRQVRVLVFYLPIAIRFLAAVLNTSIQVLKTAHYYIRSASLPSGRRDTHPGIKSPPVEWLRSERSSCWNLSQKSVHFHLLRFGVQIGEALARTRVGRKRKSLEQTKSVRRNTLTLQINKNLAYAARSIRKQPDSQNNSTLAATNQSLSLQSLGMPSLRGRLVHRP